MIVLASEVFLERHLFSPGEIRLGNTARGSSSQREDDVQLNRAKLVRRIDGIVGDEQHLDFVVQMFVQDISHLLGGRWHVSSSR